MADAPVARAHIRLEEDGLEADIEVVNGEHMQVADSPVDLYLKPPEKHWRCFHCDEVFWTAELAQIHFGVNEMCEPMCAINHRKYREMELAVERAAAEDTETDRAMHRMAADHRTALIREEEKGYAKGVAEMQNLTKEALLDATAHLVAATFAYKYHASRHRVFGRGRPDALYSTKVKDYEAACERAQKVLRDLFGGTELPKPDDPA
jgi:hypothetical protein